MASTKVQRIMTQPISLRGRQLGLPASIRTLIAGFQMGAQDHPFEVYSIGLSSNPLEGFDEYMNLVLDDAEEVGIKKKSRKQLGRILLQGDNITLMMNTYGEIGRAAAVQRGTAFCITAQPGEAEVSIEPCLKPSLLVWFFIYTNCHDRLSPLGRPSHTHKVHIHIAFSKNVSNAPDHARLVHLTTEYEVSFQAYVHTEPSNPCQMRYPIFHSPLDANISFLGQSTCKFRLHIVDLNLDRVNRVLRLYKIYLERLTSAGTMGALTAVAESSPLNAPTTASAISTATPS
ncbi:hypothetical protein RJ639_034782 [Escallonia herrerae]|uniref:Sm protein E n=1 Tax=Escallonia herrerae TaxID=1293975 RepID=A0AA88WWN1_9ASTE|nr:hypothetical protein RJ639_034782 [Escallonia herrerae]